MIKIYRVENKVDRIGPYQKEIEAYEERQENCLWLNRNNRWGDVDSESYYYFRNGLGRAFCHDGTFQPSGDNFDRLPQLGFRGQEERSPWRCGFAAIKDVFAWFKDPDMDQDFLANGYVLSEYEICEDDVRHGGHQILARIKRGRRTEEFQMSEARAKLNASDVSKDVDSFAAVG